MYMRVDVRVIAYAFLWLESRPWYDPATCESPRDNETINNYMHCPEWYSIISCGTRVAHFTAVALSCDHTVLHSLCAVSSA
jgi:hypothetical protein